MPEQIQLAVVAPNGRMGAQVCRLADLSDDFVVQARVVPPGEQGGLLLDAVDAGEVDVMIDFSHHSVAELHATWCASNDVGLVLGTTGLARDAQNAVERAAQRTLVFQASNFSIGVALLSELAAKAASVLGVDADIEIVEAHHHHKVDAPSGTAITLGKAVADARGQRYEEVAVDGRTGVTGARPPGQIGMHALRMADIVGRHDVHLNWPAEGLLLRHEARDRAVFASGALRAARYLFAQRASGKTGMVSMSDLLA